MKKKTYSAAQEMSLTTSHGPFFISPALIEGGWASLWPAVTLGGAKKKR
jgi:hypothetical protein